MNRDGIYKEMEGTFGFVPTFFKGLTDASLEYEWGIFKTTDLGETAIPHKYKELVGVGVAAALHCRYCSFFHTEMARFHGASDAEINEANYLAKCTSGWSAYLNGSQLDFEQFKGEVRRAGEYIQRKTAKKAA